MAPWRSEQGLLKVSPALVHAIDTVQELLLIKCMEITSLVSSHYIMSLKVSAQKVKGGCAYEVRYLRNAPTRGAFSAIAEQRNATLLAG
jgi:hypothetical protein